MRDIPPIPSKTATYPHPCSLTLLCSLWPRKSAARRSTRAMYIRSPEEEAFSRPITISAVGLLSLYTLDKPIPRAMPKGVVTEKKKAMIAFIRKPYSAWRMHIISMPAQLYSPKHIEIYIYGYLLMEVFNIPKSIYTRSHKRTNNYLHIFIHTYILVYG